MASASPSAIAALLVGLGIYPMHFKVLARDFERVLSLWAFAEQRIRQLLRRKAADTYSTGEVLSLRRTFATLLEGIGTPVGGRLSASKVDYVN